MNQVGELQQQEIPLISHSEARNISRFTKFVGVAVCALAFANPLATTEASAAGTSVTVNTERELQDALNNADPGETIFIVPGEYDGFFTMNRSGTSEKPITVKGTPGVVLKGTFNDRGQTLKVTNGNYLRLEDFAIEGGISGLVLEKTNNTLVSGLTISKTGNEGIDVHDGAGNW